MTRKIRPSRPAFTLLEVLLAVSVLALMTLLLAALGTQLRSWSDDGQRVRASMRVQRAVEAMRDQWSARVVVSNSVEGLVTTPAYLSFLTSRPILVTDFPVVRATYRWVSRETESGERTYDLVLEETPVGRIGYIAPERREQDARREEGEPQKQPSPEEREAERRRRDRELRESIDTPAETWPLLEGYALGAWERYGRGAIVIRNEEATDADRGLTAEHTLASPDVLAEQRRPRWRAFEEELPGTPRAVRLTGQRGKEPFTCVFVTEDSR